MIFTLKLVILKENIDKTIDIFCENSNVQNPENYREFKFLDSLFINAGVFTKILYSDIDECESFVVVGEFNNKQYEHMFSLLNKLSPVLENTMCSVITNDNIFLMKIIDHKLIM